MCCPITDLNVQHVLLVLYCLDSSVLQFCIVYLLAAVHGPWLGKFCTQKVSEVCIVVSSRPLHERCLVILCSSVAMKSVVHCWLRLERPRMRSVSMWSICSQLHVPLLVHINVKYQWHQRSKNTWSFCPLVSNCVHLKHFCMFFDMSNSSWQLVGSDLSHE